MPWTSLRTVVLEHVAQEQHDKLVDTVPRFEDAYRALEWLLARSPERGKHREVNGVRWQLYVQGSDKLAQTPEIWVLFRFTDDEVFVQSLNAVTPDAE